MESGRNEQRGAGLHHTPQHDCCGQAAIQLAESRLSFGRQLGEPCQTCRSAESPVTTIAKALDAIEDEVVHYELKTDLIEHVWRRFGERQ